MNQAATGWSRFLDTLGHELRTPLTSILGYQELLEEGIYGELEPRGAEAVRRMGSAAQELLSLLNGMVDMGRPPDAPPELDLAPVPLAPLLAQVADHGRRIAGERGVDWDHTVPDDLGSIDSDETRLERALFLCVLATLRAASGGEVRLAARAENEGATVDLIGIHAQQLPEPPFHDVVMQRAGDDTERSVLRMAIALDTLHRLDCSWELLDRSPPTLRLHLRNADAPGAAPARASR